MNAPTNATNAAPVQNSSVDPAPSVKRESGEPAVAGQPPAEPNELVHPLPAPTNFPIPGDDPQDDEVQGLADCLIRRGVAPRLAVTCAKDLWELQRGRDIRLDALMEFRRRFAPATEEPKFDFQAQSLAYAELKGRGSFQEDCDPAIREYLQKSIGEFLDHLEKVSNLQSAPDRRDIVQGFFSFLYLIRRQSIAGFSAADMGDFVQCHAPKFTRLVASWEGVSGILRPRARSATARATMSQAMAETHARRRKRQSSAPPSRGGANSSDQLPIAA